MIRVNRRQLTAIAVAAAMVLLFAYGIGMDFTDSKSVLKQVQATDRSSILGLQSVLDLNK
ncbi:MAG: hypothetical protein ACM3UZ_00575 [Acidobacteriota bacterium]